MSSFREKMIAAKVVSANIRRYADTSIATDYLAEDHHRTRQSRMIDLVRRTAPQRGAAPRVLEVGAGAPNLARALRDLGYRVTVSDADVRALAELVPPDIDTLSFDVTEPWPSFASKFDVVVAGELIEHLFDPMSFLDSCRNALATGGLLVLSTPNLAAVQDRLRFLFGASPRHIDPTHPYLRLHIRPFTMDRLDACLRHSGFELVRSTSNGLVWRVGHRVLRSRLLGRLLPTLGDALIVAARAVD
ncbi:class I SAM-dependent methyltransferase [Saccharopolyspora sp. 5N708]|uniref:class I SAM-dependent methyltransferase n=1 Tax=Saccharopolyspora sp. 5N708 TaxID=3457424 RepID=UPI003FCFA4D4